MMGRGVINTNTHMHALPHTHTQTHITVPDTASVMVKQVKMGIPENTNTTASLTDCYLTPKQPPSRGTHTTTTHTGVLSALPSALNEPPLYTERLQELFQLPHMI